MDSYRRFGPNRLTGLMSAGWFAMKARRNPDGACLIQSCNRLAGLLCSVLPSGGCIARRGRNRDEREGGENPPRTRRCKGHLFLAGHATVGDSDGKADSLEGEQFTFWS